LDWLWRAAAGRTSNAVQGGYRGRDLQPSNSAHSDHIRRVPTPLRASGHSLGTPDRNPSRYAKSAWRAISNAPEWCGRAGQPASRPARLAAIFVLISGGRKAGFSLSIVSPDFDRVFEALVPHGR